MTTDAPAGAVDGGVAGNGPLMYLPAREFERLRAADLTPLQRAAVFCAYARLNILYMIAAAGSGHIGTCFSAVEIMAWLYLREMKNVAADDHTSDIFFSSKGHDAPALYSVLLGLGLLDFELIHRLRRLGGLPGHPHVATPFVHANTGSLGMGISKAKGMVEANRLRGLRRSIYVMTGDGELQEGQLWESLTSAANRGLGEIVAVVDHNKIQSDTWVDEVSNLGDLEAKFAGFGWHVARCDGHNLEALDGCFRAFDKIEGQPKVLIADTIKGKGVSFMESTAIGPGDFYHFHSGAPSAAEYAAGLRELRAAVAAAVDAAGLDEPEYEALPHTPRQVRGNQQRLVPAYARELIRQAESNPAIVAFDADLMLDTGLIPFREQFPDRFIECGIAEQDMVSQAGGAAAMGMLPVVHSFACFLSTRPNEQIYNNATEGRKVIYVGSLAGLLPGGPGHSHQSVRDVSTLGAVPGLILIEPCTEIETARAVDFCINRTGESSYIRLVSVGWEMPFAHPSDYELSLGRGTVVRDGGDIVVFGYGPWLVANAYHAADLLRADGHRVRVVDLPWLNRLDTDWFASVIDGAKWVIPLDNHYQHGGQGDMLLSRLAALGSNARGCQIGITEVPVCGGTFEVQQAHGLDPQSLAAGIRERIEE